MDITVMSNSKGKKMIEGRTGAWKSLTGICYSPWMSNVALCPTRYAPRHPYRFGYSVTRSTVWRSFRDWRETETSSETPDRDSLSSQKFSEHQ